MSFNKITVEAVVGKNLGIVWDAYTKPEQITKWNFASDDWCCPSAEVDLRVGGSHKARMEAKDKSFGFDFVAIYEEVVLHKKIKLKMSDGRTATTEFCETNGKTTVVTVFDAEKVNSEQMQKDGWQAILNNFKKYVETSKE